MYCILYRDVTNVRTRGSSDVFHAERGHERQRPKARQSCERETREAAAFCTWHPHTGMRPVLRQGRGRGAMDLRPNCTTTVWATPRHGPASPFLIPADSGFCSGWQALQPGDILVPHFVSLSLRCPSLSLAVRSSQGAFSGSSRQHTQTHSAADLREQSPALPPPKKRHTGRAPPPPTPGPSP